MMTATKVSRALIVCLFLGGVLGVVLVPRPAVAQFDAGGWVTDWLAYGPLSQYLPTGADLPAPGIDVMRLDYISDADDVYEATMLPEEGEAVTPDFTIDPLTPGASAAIGFHPVLVETPARWIAVDTASTAAGGAFTNSVNLVQLYGAGVDQSVNNAVVYGVFYVENPGAVPVDALVQVASDDSIQVKIDDCEAIISNLGRGWGGTPDVVQNEAPVSIAPGVHRVLVKVFNGNGGFGWRLRFAKPGTGTDAATREPITDVTTPALLAGLEPGTLTAITPQGVVASRLGVVPNRVVGIDRVSEVTLAVTKTYPLLPDATIVTIRETLPDLLAYEAGSGVPAPKSVAGGAITWELPLSDAVADGIRYGVRFVATGNGCIEGEVSYVGGAGCGNEISWSIETSCVFAAPLNAIYLGDIVGGGDGTGSKDPGIWGLSLDTGLFLTEADVRAQNFGTTDTDGINPSPVDDSPFVDAVFFMNTQTVAINMEGVQHSFRAGDENDTSYNHALSNLTNDIDKLPGQVLCGGVQYTTGVGLHASAGVTFNLDELRLEYGEKKVVNFVGVLGTDGCAGGNTVNLYVIFSDDSAVIDSKVFEFTGANQSTEVNEPIPAEAVYMTLATGDRNDGIGCDHGVFAEARITPELPVARFTADPIAGGPPLTVSFDAGLSTAPAGGSIVKYDWDFGDGTKGTGQTTSHVFQTRGRYTVTLTVTDDASSTAFATDRIQALFASGDVSPWVSVDVGQPATVGGARSEGGCLVVFGGGTGVSGNADQFHLVYQTIAGDAILSGRVEAAAWEPGGRAGLMARASADPDSAMAFMSVAPITTGLRATFISRAAKGDRAVSRNAPVTFLVPQPPNLHLRIERAGAEAIGYASDDGASWTEVGRVTFVVPPGDMLFGPGVAGVASTVSPDNVATVTFCNVAFGSAPPQEDCTNGVDDDGDGLIDCADPDCAAAPNCQGARFRRGDADASDGVVNITDAIFVLNYLFQGGSEPPCLDAADADNEFGINITDGIYILSYLFLGGPAPPDPGPNECGLDPALDPPSEPAPPLDCKSYPPEC